jgi:signal transduction histidine kinase/ActR/RegA family two-component response regulator
MNNFFLQLQKFSKKLIYSGVRDSHDCESRRKIFLFNSFSYISILCLLALGVTAFIDNDPFLGYTDLFTALSLLSLVIYLHYSGNQVFCSYITAILANLFFCYLFYTGGVKSTAFMWLYTYPTLSFFLLGLYRGSIATLFLFLFSLIFLVIDLSSQTINVYHLDFALRFIPSFLVVFFFSFLLERSRAIAQDALLRKQEVLSSMVERLTNHEKQLERAQDMLEQRVNERTAELLEINLQLKDEIESRKQAEQDRRRLENELSRAQKMEVLGRLAGGVAHDLNNVLSGIVSYPDLLLLDLAADSPMRGPLEIIKKSGERAAAIVQDLLALARRGVMVKQVVSLNDVLREYMESLEFIKLCKAHPGISVEQHPALRLQLMAGSPVHLQKAVMNLVVNAFEAVKGHGRVVITTKNVRLDSAVNGYELIKEGNYVVLIIQDSGAGMSAEVLSKIFEPFYTRKQMGRSGTGLGMTVVWGTIKDHGGYLDIESSPGKGTTITIYFPVSSTDATSHPAESRDNKQLCRGNGQTILIVDDMVVQQEIGISILKKLGYRAWSVSSGEEAVEFIKKQPVDLVLLDMIMLPGMDGLETFQQMVQINPNQKAVIVSGYSKNDRVRQALELGIGAHLKKPYTIEQVNEVINNELAK